MGLNCVKIQRYIFLHQIDICHTNLLTMVIDAVKVQVVWFPVMYWMLCHACSPSVSEAVIRKVLV